MIRSAFKKNLDLKFRDRASGKTIHVLERPGVWLEDQALQKLVKDLCDLVRVSLKNESLDYGIFSGKRESLNNVILTVIYDKQGSVVAFNCLSYMPCTLGGRAINMVHLGLIVVHPDVRLGGVSWILYGLTTTLLYLRNRFRPIWVSNVTQVPAIVGKVAEGFGEVYPDPMTNRPMSFKHLVLAREIMKKHRGVFGVGPDAHFDEKRFVIENSYTGGSDNLKKKFTEAPVHRNEVFNKFCQAQLNYDRGDDILQIGKINTEIIHEYMMRDVPSKSFVSVLGLLIFTVLQSVVIPLLVWFQPNKHQGAIRPWKT